MPDNPKKAKTARRPLHAHLVKHGPMTRQNPELIRIANATGYSADHIYKIAIGSRDAQLRTARAISDACGEASTCPEGRPVTAASLMSGWLTAEIKPKRRRATRSA